MVDGLEYVQCLALESRLHHLAAARHTMLAWLVPPARPRLNEETPIKSNLLSCSLAPSHSVAWRLSLSSKWVTSMLCCMLLYQSPQCVVVRCCCCVLKQHIAPVSIFVWRISHSHYGRCMHVAILGTKWTAAAANAVISVNRRSLQMWWDNFYSDFN